MVGIVIAIIQKATATITIRLLLLLLCQIENDDGLDQNEESVEKNDDNYYIHRLRDKLLLLLILERHPPAVKIMLSPQPNARLPNSSWHVLRKRDELTR
jgi:hypothetical protein